MSGNLTSVRKAPNNRTMGIEIECIMDHRPSEYQGFFVASYDGSIRTSYIREEFAVEWVSQPLTYKWMLREITKLGKKFKWKTNSSCGIHVHVSKQWLSDKRAITIRKALSLLSYSQCVELFGREPNDYCMQTTNARERYGQLNSTNHYTQEFRVFASGDANWAKECVRRTKLMVNHRGKFTYDALLDLFTNPEES